MTTASRAGVTPEQPAHHRQATAWFTAEYRVLCAVLDYAANAGLDTHTLQLTWTLDLSFYRHAHWHDQAAAWRHALEAGKRLGDRAAQARAHRNLGGSDIRLGRHHDEAVSTCTRLSTCTASTSSPDRSPGPCRD
jgi:hypothetical protein